MIDEMSLLIGALQSIVPPPEDPQQLSLIVRDKWDNLAVHVSIHAPYVDT